MPSAVHNKCRQRAFPARTFLEALGVRAENLCEQPVNRLERIHTQEHDMPPDQASPQTLTG